MPRYVPGPVPGGAEAGANLPILKKREGGRGGGGPREGRPGGAAARGVRHRPPAPVGGRPAGGPVPTR